MNVKIQSKKKKKKKLELISKININSLEKKPQNGGTPAIDKSKMIKTFVNIFVEPRFANENKVFNSKLINWNSVKKNTDKVIL